MSEQFFRVFRLPEKFPSEYCFGDGVPVNFQMVDWFGGTEKVTRGEVNMFIRKKRYASGKLLVMERGGECWIIDMVARAALEAKPMTEDYDVDATMRLMQAELAAMKTRAETAEKDAAALREALKKAEMDITTLRMAWSIQYENQKAAWRRTQALEEEKNAKTDG